MVTRIDFSKFVGKEVRVEWIDSMAGGGWTLTAEECYEVGELSLTGFW